jgi:hypothetical protein
MADFLEQHRKAQKMCEKEHEEFRRAYNDIQTKLAYDPSFDVKRHPAAKQYFACMDRYVKSGKK